MAGVCQSLGIQLCVCLPDDQSDEKKRLLETLNVQVQVQPCCSISNKDNYVNAARRLAKEMNAVFFDQFENLNNFRAHLETTGPEIWKQVSGKIDSFVMSAGTGGTIAGVSCYLKSKNPNIKVVLADPQGSSLFQRVQYGVCYTGEQCEKKIRKHRYDSIVEGVGLDRITKNFEQAKIDSAIRVNDQEVLEMAHWIMQNEGLFIGSSSALNLVAVCKTAYEFPEGANLVTIICDSGNRHISRFWNPKYVEEKYSLKWPKKCNVPTFLQNPC